MDAKEMKVYLLEDTDRILKTLEHYDFHSAWVGNGEIRCATPEGTNRTSVVISLSEELFATCFSDNFRGDIYGLVEHFKGLSFIEVLSGINNLFGFSVGTYKPSNKIDLLKEIRTFKSKSKRVFVNKKYHKSILDKYIKKQHASMIQECISPSVLEMFNVSFSPRDSRIIIPHFDESGEWVVGIQARHTESAEMCKMLDIQKYMNVIVGFKKSHNLYGWHLAKDNVNDTKYLVILESEKSVMKQTTFNYGVCSSVALGGHMLSDYHVQTIVKGTEPDVEIVLAMDNDVPEEEVIEMCKRFSKYRKTSYVYDQYKILGEKSACFDKGYKKFDVLWRHRRPVN